MFPQRDKRIITGWRYLGILGCHASPANWVRIEVLVAKVRGFRKRKQNGVRLPDVNMITKLLLLYCRVHMAYSRF